MALLFHSQTSMGSSSELGRDILEVDAAAEPLGFLFTSAGVKKLLFKMFQTKIYIYIYIYSI